MMFKKLRTQFVLTAMALLSVVVIVSFVAIYVSTAARFSLTPPDNRLNPAGFDLPANSSTFRSYIDEQRRADAAQALSDLALTLVLTGAATLTAGYFVSRYLANRAIAPVEKAYEQQKQFIADASHELKTPLAVIEASLEAEFVGRKRRSRWLTGAQAEVEHMNALVTDLLALARLESTETTSQSEQYDLRSLLQQALNSFESRASERDLHIVSDLSPKLAIKNDKELTRRIIVALLDNALKYTSDGGQIKIHTEAARGTVTVTVANTHPPMPPQQLQRVFERFYQVDSSHKTEGHGLGLAIAQSAAESLGGELSVSQAKGMVAFSLTLPSET